MLYKNEDFETDLIQEASDILDEAVYLEQDEVDTIPSTIPVIENSRLNTNIVKLSDVDKISESYCVDYFDAMQIIAESNDISIDELAVSVPEWEIIADPDIVNELSNVIVAPISSNNPMYQFIEACIDTTIEEADESIFTEACDELLLELSDELIKRAAMKRYQNIGSHIDKINMINKYGKRSYNPLNYRFELSKRDMAAIKNLYGKMDEEARKGRRTLGKAAKIMKDEEYTRSAENNIRSTNPRDKEFNKRIASDFERSSKNGYSANKNKLKEIRNKLSIMKTKIKEKTPVKYIVQAISSLKKKYQEYKAKLDKVPDDQKNILQKICSLIMKAIDKFNEYLQKAKNLPDKIEQDAVDDAYKNYAEMSKKRGRFNFNFNF